MEDNNGNPGLPEQFLNNFKEENRTFISSKGYKSADDIVTALQAADNMVALPTEKSTEEELNAFYAKLGRPTSADKYAFGIKEGESDEFAKQIAPALFAAGISQKQLNTILPKWNEIMTSTQEAQAKAMEEEFDKATEELKAEWGANYDANETLAKRATKAIGLTPEEVDGLVKAKGTAWVYKTMAKFGKALGDGDIKGLNGKTEKNYNDPKEAEAELNRLMKDADFAAKIAASDAEALKTWEKLSKAAYGSDK